MPPKICTASSAILFNISEQNTLTIAASASLIEPSSARDTASLTSKSAARRFMAPSAKRNPVA